MVICLERGADLHMAQPMLLPLSCFIKSRLVLTARFYASAVVAMGCVCPSQVTKSVFYRNGWTNQAGFWHVSFLPPVLDCVKRKFVIYKNKGTFLWNFVLNSGFRKFRHGISIVETCYQLSSRMVDAQSVINWAVVGQWQDFNWHDASRGPSARWASCTFLVPAHPYEKCRFRLEITIVLICKCCANVVF